jgi:hypothetical protein
MLPDDIESLQHHEAFASLVQQIVQMREDCIQDLHKADMEVIQQTSGRILALDEIIELCDWEVLRNRFPNS